jgi:hypothetical protein
MSDTSTGRYVIRVTGVEPHAHTAVVGAVYLSGNPAGVHLVTQPTPFEVSGPAQIVSGMLQAADPTQQILVEVLRGDGQQDPGRVTMARARTVLLGEQLLRESSRFIRGAP